jgi:hypothetical protein
MRSINKNMNTISLEQLIASGNQARADNNPDLALTYYMQAMCIDRNNPAAFNNWGNVLREAGEPEAAIPFLQRAIQLDPSNATAQFNLAVAYLLNGDYEKGWTQYETRWNYEHLNGVLPKFSQPRWKGEDLNGKTIFVLSEQGHGDTIQFVRFTRDLAKMGAKVILHAEPNIVSLLKDDPTFDRFVLPTDAIPEHFDYWTPVMSLPGIMGITLDNLPSLLKYLTPDPVKCREWLTRLGPKNKLRIGFNWSGRRDTWINLHKSIPFEVILELVRRTPEYEWYNLQIDCTPEEALALQEAGAKIVSGDIHDFADTAALIEAMDVVIGVDTASTHLAGAIGKPAWLLLNWFGTDWRWLLNRDDSPWYESVRIFRQPSMGDWHTPIAKVEKFLTWFKI